MKVSSQKLFEFIIKYLKMQQFNHEGLSLLQQDRVILFLECISKWYYTLDDREFSEIVDNYIVDNIDRFNKSELQKLLDLLKLNPNFYSKNTKLLISARL